MTETEAIDILVALRDDVKLAHFGHYPRFNQFTVRRRVQAIDAATRALVEQRRGEHGNGDISQA